MSARAKMGDGTARRREAHPCFFFAGLNRDLNEMDAVGTSVLSQEERLAARESLRRFVSFEEFGRIRGRAVVSEEERRALSFLDPDSGNVLPSYAIPAAYAVPAGESFWRGHLRHVELNCEERIRLWEWRRQAACALQKQALLLAEQASDGVLPTSEVLLAEVPFRFAARLAGGDFFDFRYRYDERRGLFQMLVDPLNKTERFNLVILSGAMVAEARAALRRERGWPPTAVRLKRAPLSPVK